MNEQIYLQELEIVLSSGKLVEIPHEKIRKILAHVKNLERCLADALRLAHARRLESEAG